MSNAWFPDLTEIFAESRNAAQLKHAWVEWRKASGNKYRKEYLDFIGINSEAAKSLGKTRRTISCPYVIH